MKTFLVDWTVGTAFLMVAAIFGYYAAKFIYEGHYLASLMAVVMGVWAAHASGTKYAILIEHLERDVDEDE